MLAPAVSEANNMRVHAGPAVREGHVSVDLPHHIFGQIRNTCELQPQHTIHNLMLASTKM
ncbi:hypothetical protein EYF80_065209 [Liparis tanakae]|uniref:Uncharacterized protein n=1 Tax=Liparis tanakae TaxID=230148 RepID=A0A4Z2E7B8_9TELE|nr:hypothetical protein EYF80_065209 [Liparis tanakae]